MQVQLEALETPTLDAVVSESVILGTLLIVVVLVIWLAWRILGAFDRELERRKCHDTPPRVIDTTHPSTNVHHTTADDGPEPGG